MLATSVALQRTHLLRLLAAEHAGQPPQALAALEVTLVRANLAAIWR
jgi:hypothetical protein